MCQSGEDKSKLKTAQNDFDVKRWCIAIALFLGAIWCVLIVISLCGNEAIGRIAAVGDSFGVTASLFSAWGFLGLIYTILQQRESIRQQGEMINQQTNAIRMQKEELELTRKEMEKTRQEHEEQTEQFKKTYELEKRAKVVAARPDLEVDPNSYTDTTEDWRHVVDLKFHNHGGEMRNVKYRELAVRREEEFETISRELMLTVSPRSLSDSPLECRLIFHNQYLINLHQKKACYDFILHFAYNDELGYDRVFGVNFRLSWNEYGHETFEILTQGVIKEEEGL